MLRDPRSWVAFRFSCDHRVAADSIAEHRSPSGKNGTGVSVESYATAQVLKVPSTSGSLVEAWLPVMVVLSMVAVPMIAMPPPTPTVNVSTVPFWPVSTEPLAPEGDPPRPIPTLLA